MMIRQAQSRRCAAWLVNLIHAAPALPCARGIPYMAQATLSTASRFHLVLYIKGKGVIYLAAVAAGFLTVALRGFATLAGLDIEVTLFDKVCTRADSLLTSSAVGTPS